MGTREDLCSEDEIKRLVYTFYDRVRADETLGPIFNHHVKDWDKHLGRMVQFWSSLMRGTGTYQGAPMPVHIALPDLSADLFQRWLALFHATVMELPNRLLAERAEEFARRIANSLWLGYQYHNHPERPATEVNCG